MANVLGAVEDTKSQAVEKVSRRQIASHGSNGEACAFLEKPRDVFQLRNVVLTFNLEF